MRPPLWTAFIRVSIFLANTKCRKIFEIKNLLTIASIAQLLTSPNNLSYAVCKSCLIKQLELVANKCPVCKIAINREESFSSLRFDSVLQRLIYKIVPSLFASENERRQAFYKEHLEDSKFLRFLFGFCLNSKNLTSPRLTSK